MMTQQATSPRSRVRRRLSRLYWPLLFWSAAAGGVGGFLGWAPGELMHGPLRYTSWIAMYSYDFVYFLVIGASIGAVLGALPGLLNRSWRQSVRGAVIGGLIGGFGGGLGALPAQYSYNALGDGLLARAVGWAILGLSIGLGPGAATRDLRRALRGLLGGFVGGFAGGVLFNLVAYILPSSPTDTGTASRFVADIVVGLCIGAMVALVEVVLKNAWLKVLNGRREGAQFILSKPVTAIGRDDRDDVLLWGDAAMATRHAHIERTPHGYHIQPLSAEAATWVNQKPISGPTLLQDGDELTLGATRLSFHTHGSPPELAKPVARIVPSPDRIGEPASRPIAAASSTIARGNYEAPMMAPPPNTPIVAPPSRERHASQPAGGAGVATAIATQASGFRLVAARDRRSVVSLPQRAVLTIGRDPSNDISLTDATVSGRHAELRREDGRWIVYDLQSTNGTYVSFTGGAEAERRVERNALKIGSTVRFGEAKFYLDADIAGDRP